MPDLKVLRPAILAKYMPIMAVRNIKLTVTKAPMFWPILIITNISRAGTPIKNNKSVIMSVFKLYY